MLKYNKLTHQTSIIQDAILALRKSIDTARKSVNQRYLDREITVYEMSNQLLIFDFFDKFLKENLIKNGLGLISLLDLFENIPYRTKEEFEELNALRFYLCDMVGIDRVEKELDSFEKEGI